MIQTTVLLKGLDQVIARLDQVEADTGDLRPVWPELARLFAARQNEVFASNGLHSWAPESSATLRQNVSPLVDSGIMREGLTNAAPIWAKEKAVAFGASKYDRRVMNPAVLHTVGTKHMPGRIPVPKLRAAERRAWIDLIDRHIKKAIR